MDWIVDNHLYEGVKTILLAGDEFDDLSLTPPGDTDILSLLWFFFTWPYVFLFAITMPTWSQTLKPYITYIVFFMSLVWLGFLSYYMVLWIEIIGATIGIPTVLMGLTFVAIGVSVPDTLSAVIVARQGQADKSVSSSIGSNVFDISVGLALPWLFYWIYYQKPVAVDASSLFISIIGVIVATFLLLGIARQTYAWSERPGWALSPQSGYLLVVLYVAYVAWQAGTTDFGTC
jgi:Ca2+/Na+ antiporter